MPIITPDPVGEVSSSLERQNAISIAALELLSNINSEEDERVSRLVEAQGKAFAGDIAMTLVADALASSAALLNSLPANSVIFDVVAQLKDSGGELLHSLSFTPLLTVTTVIGDNARKPVAVGTPKFVNGEMVATFVIPTDAGVTITHVNADQYTIDVQVNAADELSGNAVAPLVFTLSIGA